MNIYVEAGCEAPADRIRRVGCVMEWDKGITKQVFGKKKGTYNDAILKTLIDVVGRLPEEKEINIFSKNVYVLKMIGKQLDVWQQNGYVRKDGKPVKSAELWQQLADKIKGREVSAVSGPHSYYNWMIREMKKQDSEVQKE